MKQDRLLILTEYFYPDTASGTGRIMTELAEDLAKNGISVDVVCGQPSYRWRERAPSREDWHGVTVTRVSELETNRYSGIGRLVCWAWFMLQCLVRVPFWRRKYHRILVVTNPAPALSIGWLFKRGRTAGYVALVHDVFPENAIAVGKSRENSLAVRVMKSLNRVSLRAADTVVTIGEDMKRLLCADYGLPPDQVQVIPNWASKTDPPNLVDADAIDDWQCSLGLGDRFLVLYAGNFGFAQDADLLIQCLAACSHRADVLFCFAGGGGQYERLRNEETSGAIPNLKVVPFQTGTRYASLLKLADCGLVSLHPYLRGMAVPSKVTTYMATGLPVICLAEQDSDLANMVEETASGITCQSPEQFAEAVRLIVSDEELRSRLSGNALRAAETKYSRSQCISSFVEVLSRLP
jgi:glycosyltransferase involved in cell wall biosynthesis